MTVRVAAGTEFPAIRRVLVAAFERSAEADLVEALRATGDAVIELVAGRDGDIAGHVLLSALQAPENCLALAPVAVRPACQSHGIGSALIRAALERAGEEGWRAVFLLGEPGYYARFGFSVAAAAGFETDYPRSYFMARELRPGALDDCGGAVIFAGPFQDLENQAT